ncbi:MAG: hypothetical protein ACQXXH_01545 [Candidatus Bathyarchaeia archaeon]|jgi:hypothetical protein|nr:hypothetical protein [Candidatus Bathyarchaeota archaeon A05DMB-4]MDH7596081.1 hypothetical protein [Candidatus Bathyarchaeota archaeon]
MKKINLPKLTSWLLITLGALALVSSVAFVSQILAFIGLGLTLWGTILLYITPEEYTKTAILDTTITTLLTTIEKIIQDGNYTGKAVYLPPKYLKDFESSKAYLTKEKTTPLPQPEQTQQQENPSILTNSNSILLTPPGADLVKLFEKTLGTSFTKVDLPFLENNLPKLLIEDLELTENTEIQTNNNKIQVKIENITYKNTSNQLKKLTTVTNLLGCPTSSAIACALAKATGKPIEIGKHQISNDGKTITIVYNIIEEQKTEAPQA